MNKIFIFMRESSLARTLIPIGLITIVFGVFMFIISSKNQNYIKTEATVSNVVEIENTYTINDNESGVEKIYNVDLKYTVDSKEYDGTLDNVSKYNVGDKITIYYNPDDPSQITQTISLILPIIITAGGALALVGGIISGMNSIKKYKQMKEQEKG